MTLVFAGLVLALLGLGYYAPGAALAAVLATFAVGAGWVLDPPGPALPLDLATRAHATLLLAAMTGSALRHGVRAGIRNWPLIAVALLLLQSLVAIDLRSDLGALEVLLAAYALALPFVLVHLVLPPGARSLAAAVIGALPLISVALGYLLEAYGWYAPFANARLQGATNAGWLGAMGYVGFAVALHEGLRSSRMGFIYLAAASAVVTILSAGRMAVFACLVHLAVYCLASPQLARRMGRLGAGLAVAGGLVVLALVYYLPVLQQRMTGGEDGAINFSGRDEIWAANYAAFLEAPWLGLGLGSTSLVDSYFDLPHNEYLRVLVEGGVVGFVLFALAVVLWARQLLRRVEPGERAFLVAALTSLALFAVTDNVLSMSPILVLFAYLSFVLPSRLEAPVRPPQPGPARRALEARPDADPWRPPERAPWERPRRRRFEPGR